MSHLPTELLVLHRNQEECYQIMLFCLKPCGVFPLPFIPLHYKALLASSAALPTIYPLFLKFQLPVFFTFSCWPVSVFRPPAWNPLPQLFMNSWFLLILKDPAEWSVAYSGKYTLTIVLSFFPNVHYFLTHDFTCILCITSQWSISYLCISTWNFVHLSPHTQFFSQYCANVLVKGNGQVS